MTSLGAAMAAAVSAQLARMGASADEHACWWNSPRRELGGLSPHQALATGVAGAGPKVLDLACRDVADAEEAARGLA